MPSLPPIGFALKILFMHWSQKQEHFRITKKCYYQAFEPLPCNCLISQDIKRKQSIHCCEKQYLNRTDFQNCGFLHFVVAACKSLHVWTFNFKSFHPLASLKSLPNILKAISWQQLKHFKSVKGRKFNFTLNTISFAILSKYSYYEHVMRLPTKKCMVMLCKQSCRLCSDLFPRNTEFSKNMSHGYFWFTFTWTLKFSCSEH